MQVKIIDEGHEKDLEESVNAFLETGVEVFDIKFQVAMAIAGEDQYYCFTAMIMYRK